VGHDGIGYNVAKIKERMPDAPLDSWAMLFDPDVVSKFADCGVQVLDSPDDVLPAALNYLGLNPDSKDPADLQKARDLMLSVRPHIQKFHSSEYINALANGDICLAVGYSGDVLQARDRATEAGNKVEIAYSIPKEGALIWLDSFAIPADAPHPDEAHAFIDFMLRPEIAARNSNFVNYANGNLASQALLDAAVREDPAIYPDAATLAKLYTTTPNDTRVQREVTRVWTEVKTGQ
jgi:putrescine transport system substrate-binding protein